MSKLWDSSQMGGGSVSSTSAVAQTMRTVVPGAQFFPSISGTGLIVHLRARSDSAAWSLNQASLALVIPGTAGKEYYLASLTPLSFYTGSITSPGTITVPASGTLYSDALDWC